MAKNLANQYYEYTSVRKKTIPHNSIQIIECDVCGSELIGNEPCLVCESKEKKQETRRKRSLRD